MIWTLSWAWPPSLGLPCLSCPRTTQLGPGWWDSALPAMLPSSRTILRRDCCSLPQPLPSTNVSPHLHTSVIGLYNSWWSPIICHVYTVVSTKSEMLQRLCIPSKWENMFSKSKQMIKSNHKFLQKYWIRTLKTICLHPC